MATNTGELLLAQGTCVQNMKFVSLQTVLLNRYVSVAMVKKCSWQKVKAWIAVASNSKDMSIFLCCYGNKVSITASHKMDSCGLKGPVYQIRTS